MNFDGHFHGRQVLVIGGSSGITQFNIQPYVEVGLSADCVDRFVR